MMAFKTRNADDHTWYFACVLLAQDGLLLSGLCAMGVTGIWLGLRQRSLSRASFSSFFYFIVLPASLYVIRPMSPGHITLLLVFAYCAIAVIMHRKLRRDIRGESVQRLMHRPEA